MPLAWLKDDVDHWLTFSRPVHAGYIICSDHLCHGHEYLDRLLFDGHTDTNGVEFSSPKGKEVHPPRHVQRWPARNGIRDSSLRFDFDCLFVPAPDVLSSPQTDVGILRSGTVTPLNRVTGPYESRLSLSS